MGTKGLMLVLAVTAVGCAPTVEEGDAADIQRVQQAATAPLASKFVRRIGGSRQDDATKVAMDGHGNSVMVVGYHGAAADNGTAFSSGPDPAVTNTAIVKHAPDGTVLWVREILPANSGSAAWAGALASSPNGDVFFGGQVVGDFATIEGRRLESGSFLARLDSNGHVVWARNTQPEPGTHFWFEDFAADAAGDFYALATREDTSGFTNMMLIRYRGADGAPMWGRTFEQTNGHVGGKSIAVDASKNLYVVGDASGTVTFNGAPYSAGPWSAYVASLTSDGTTRFIKPLGQDANPLDIAVSGDRVVVAVSGMPTFGGQKLSGPGVYLLAINRSAAERWQRRIANDYYDAHLATALGDVVVVCEGVASELGVQRTHPAPENQAWAMTFFVAKFNRLDGRLVAAKNIEEVGDHPYGLRAEDVAISPVDGQSAVVGTFATTTDFKTSTLRTPNGPSDAYLLQLRR